MTGMMRSAYRGHQWTRAIEGADMLLADSRSDADLKTEAEYVKARSYLATSRRDEAFSILSRLAEDVTGPYNGSRSSGNERLRSQRFTD